MENHFHDDTADLRDSAGRSLHQSGWLVGVLCLAVALELANKLLPEIFGIGGFPVELLSIGAVILLTSTAIGVVYSVSLPAHIRWCILLGALSVFASSVIETANSVEALHASPGLAIPDMVFDVSGPATFIGGLGLLLAGFYTSLFEVVAARERTEYEHECLRQEMEERKEVEAALRDSKDRYRLIFEGTEDGVALISDSFRLIQTNRRFAEMFGYTNGEIMHAGLDALIHSEDWPRLREFHRNRVAGGPAPRSLEFRARHKDGSVRTIHGTFDLIMRDNERLGTHVILRDVTEWKANEEALAHKRQMEDNVRAASTSFVNEGDELEKNIDAALARLGRFAKADKAFAFRFDRSSTKRSHLFEWCNDGAIATPPELHQVDLEALLPQVTSHLAAHNVFKIRNLAELDKRATKERRFFEREGIHAVCAVPMTFQGRAVGFVGVQYHYDVEAFTDELEGFLRLLGEIFAGAIIRRESEEALRRNEEKYRNILENIVEGYFEIDLEGNLLFCNKSLSEIYGYPLAELLETNFKKHSDEEDIAYLRETFGQVYETGQPLDAVHWRIRRSDGVWVDLEASVALMRDDDDHVVGFRGILRDVTDRLKAEEERRLLEAQVQQTQKLDSLGVLAGGVAHDFNNLLMGVLANASLALAEIPESAPERESIEQIETAAQRAAELANQMLTYSGKGRTETKPIDLSSATEEMLQLLASTLSKKATLHVDLAANLPAIEGDSTQVTQVIMNLITNASEALNQEAGVISVRTGATTVTPEDGRFEYTNFNVAPGPYVYIDIADTGCGMDEITIERVFDPFFTTKFTGRGLGLAAVMGIVRAHHGGIRIRSRPNEGTEMRVVFPATATPAPAPAAPAEAEADTDNDLSGAGRAVLVVDDEPMVRDVAERILALAGLEVMTAEDGAEALRLFRESGDSIGLVVLDMTMPRFDGTETFLEMTALRDDIPIILSSGYNSQQTVDSLDGKRPWGFLQKPYRHQDLLSLVRQALNNREQAPR